MITAARTTIRLALASTLCASAQAQVIDFESIPGQGDPTDNQLISDEFESVYGVTFVLLENDGTPADPSLGPRIAEVGGARTAFVGPTRDPDCDSGGNTTNDTPADLLNSGCWILTDDGVHPGPRPFGLRIEYSSPVLLAGGELIDVDNGPESWRITALDAADLPIVHPDNPVDIAWPTSPGVGDGTVAQFGFDLGAEIHAIELIYTGEDSFGRGLAFDNFSPAILPDPTAPFCFCDGSGTPPPCSNPGLPGRGCANGSFSDGARLTGSGDPSVGDDSFLLLVADSVPGQPGLVFQGDNAVGGGAGVAFGDGLRCAGGNVVRLEVLFPDPGGATQSTVEISTEGGVSPGDLRRYQWWYRDPVGSPCGTTFNLSNGIEVSWQP